MSTDSVHARMARYTANFKVEAVKAVLGGQEISDVANELRIPESTLHLWLNFAQTELGKTQPPPDEPAADMGGDDMAAAKKHQRGTAYDPAIRTAAIAAVRTGGKTAAQVSRDTKIHKTTILQWVRQDEADSRRPGEKPAPAAATGDKRRAGKYTPAQRDAFAALVLDKGRDRDELAEECGVTRSAVDIWVTQLQKIRGVPVVSAAAPKAPPAATPKPAQASLELETVFAPKTAPAPAQRKPRGRPPATRQSTSTQITAAYPLPHMNGHARAHVLPVSESMSLAQAYAKIAQLQAQVSKYRRMLNIAMDDEPLEVPS